MKSTRFNILLTALLAIMSMVFLSLMYHIIVTAVPEPLRGMVMISTIYALVGAMIVILRRGKSANEQS